jgi:3'-5' exoribonuclease
MKPVFVDQLTVNSGLIRSYFILSKREIKRAKNGRPYASLSFTDRTGEISGVMFDCDNIPAKVDDVVALESSVEDYEGTLQLKPSKIRIVDERDNGRYEMADFFPALPLEEREALLAEVRQLIYEYTSGDVKRLLEYFLQTIPDLLRDAPASMKLHQAYLGGLVEHVRNITLLAVRVGEMGQYKLETELLIVGAFLHDIGKIYELDYARAIRYSTTGRLIGHIATGMMLVSDACSELSIDADIRDKILHIIASHHGTKENGSPVVPCTREALVFHLLDMIDSRMAMVDAAETMPGEDEFTGYISALGAQFLRTPATTAEAATEAG